MNRLFTSILSFSFLTFGLLGCGGSTEQKALEQESEKTEAVVQPVATKPEMIIDIIGLTRKSQQDVEQILGKAESKEKIKGYPCQKSNCEKAFYQKGKYEVIFRKGKAVRITINQTPDLTADEKAIQTLGLPESSPAFKNLGAVLRWKNVEGMEEIAFFPDYVLVIVELAD